MKIRITGQSGEYHFPFETSGPWQEFKKEIVSQGHSIVADKSEMSIDALVSHRHSNVHLGEAKRNKIPISKRVLVIWEPFIVNNKNYSKRVLSQYGKVYAPSPIWASKVLGKSFAWPQDAVIEIEDLEKWSLRESKFVVIQANKFSPVRGELYSLRRKVIAQLGPHINLFGKDWNQGPVKDFWLWSQSVLRSFPCQISLQSLVGIGKFQKSFQGVSENKAETLARYKFAIVIENSPDFVSEKLFDCISAGCLVLYVGPNLEAFNLPSSNLFLCGASVEELCDAATKIMSMSVSEQYAIAKSLNSSFSSISKDWENSIVLGKLARQILTDLS